MMQAVPLKWLIAFRSIILHAEQSPDAMGSDAKRDSDMVLQAAACVRVFGNIYAPAERQHSQFSSAFNLGVGTHK